MSSNCCSRNFSSSSFGSAKHYSGTSCGSSYPSNLIYTTEVCTPSTCPLGSSLYTGCGETICEPIRCQTPCVVPISCQSSCYGPKPSTHCRPCQSSCYRPKPSMFCSPCQSSYTGFLCCGPSSSCSLSYGSGRCYSVGCGSSSYKPLACGVSSFPALNSVSGFCRPSYLTCLPCHSTYCRPTCGSGC
ncbi:keratin-associated protein 13-1-like [Suncus etruscus]|uniref:keratin-associated protein 13-1-like n=1 Tax=Suncus etruscus TaxID=109475 RepID=UPI00210FD6D3|nr:keratin-associated protein 13-1-like [Suncus etruscus]